MKILQKVLAAICLVSFMVVTPVFSIGQKEVDTSIFAPPTWVIGTWTEADGSFQIEVDSDTVYMKYDYAKTGYDCFEGYEPSIDNCKSDYEIMKYNKNIKCDDLPTLYKIEYYTDKYIYKKFIFVFPVDDEITIFEEDSYSSPSYQGGIEKTIYTLKKVH